MPTPKKQTRKLGPNRKEPAKKARKQDANFSQSRDIREDQGVRKNKMMKSGKTMPTPPRGKLRSK